MKRYQNILMSLSFIGMHLFFLSTAHAVTTFESSNQKVTLIELYTSEGCSSCPPAEAWLNALKDEQGLWKDFIPLAFHVAYWDNLGWKDRLASVEYANRQRQYAAHWGSGTVYTPEVIKNGREWKTWYREHGIKKDNSKVGRLVLECSDQESIRLEYDAEESLQKRMGNIAWVGFGIQTDVRRGENRGKKLEHDFVVLKHLSQPMRSLNENRSELTLVFPLPPSQDVKKFALVGWVSSENDLSPIQAVGGWFDGV